MKITPPALFSFCALIFFCVFVYLAQDWRMQARLYPWAIGIPMLILAIVQVILDLKGIKAKQSSDATPMDYQFSKVTDPVTARKRTITMFSWLVGFFFGIWLLGFPIAIALMMFTYLKFQGRESWVLSIALTVIAWFFFWGLFVKLLTLPFPEGLIITWLGIGA
ncbi:MAG TPA: tripartite tricarboxylate transporter TctB family protein [Candidatus Binatia bacterium]|nr:tripartite tricarboxylate transporter TctB family protein [Candidatus Binatia bacterium]